MKAQINLSGKLTERLLKGAIVIGSWNGKYSKTVLIQNPKDSEWKFTMFQNIMESINGSTELQEAINYNTTKRDALRKASEDHYEDEYHESRMVALGKRDKK